MENLKGTYIFGKMAGYNSTSRQYQGREIVNHEIGVQIESTNQYGMIETQTINIRMPQSLINQTMISQYQGMAGKDVAVPVWISAYTGRTGANFQYNLDSKKAIELVKPAATVKSVGVA